LLEGEDGRILDLYRSNPTSEVLSMIADYDIGLVNSAVAVGGQPQPDPDRGSGGRRAIRRSVSDHDAGDEADQRTVVGEMPTTSVRRPISRLTPSSGLVERSFGQWSPGKL
jgi:hypothetical protein